MASIPPAVLSCSNGNYNYQSSLTATVHRYTDPTGNVVIVKRAPQKEADTHRQISSPTNPSIIRLLDVAEISPFTPNTWLVLEHANNGTLRDFLIHARDSGAEDSTPRKIPAALCFHILAGILDAIVTLQEMHGVQHIDLHAGNVVFHMLPDSWPPVVKLIDFGKTFQLPEEENLDDVPWDEALSSSVGTLVRALLAQTDVLEDDFLSAIRALAAQRSLLGDLRTARANAQILSKTTYQNMPIWIREYFGQNIDQVGDDQRDDTEGDHPAGEDEENGDIVIRLEITLD